MTKKKTRSKSKIKAQIRDIFIALFLLGVCALSLRYFWQDLNHSFTRTDKTAIATISFKYKVAQRKFSDRVVWERLQQNSPLYSEDTIRTSDMASATITFKGGEVLEVHENSMIQIYKTADGSVLLSVTDGGIDVDTSSGESGVLAVLMENGSSIIVEKGSRLAANTNADGEASFLLRSGSGSIYSGSDSSEEGLLLSAGEAVKVESSGQVKKEPLSVTSIPSDLLVLNFEEKPSPVHLEWNASEQLADKKIIVQTSKNIDFSTIAKSYSVVNSNSVELPSETGTVYWRIFEASAKDENNTVKGRIRTENVSSPVLNTPANNSTYKYRKVLPAVNFAWGGNDYAEYYRLEVAKTPDFFEPVKVVDVTSTNYSLRDLQEGNYFWRVTPFYRINGTGFAGASKTVQFAVKKSDTLDLPVAVSPAEGANLFYVGDSLATTFRWKSEESLCDYQVLVSDSKDFSNIIFTKNAAEKFLHSDFTTEVLPAGTYYWRVKRRALASEGLEEALSEPKQFKVSFYVPQKNRLIYPPESFSVEKENLSSVSFTWKAGDELKQSAKNEGKAVESLIQFAKDAAFSEVVYENQTEQSELADVNLEGGTYFWRVGFAPSGSSDYDFTSPNKISVLNPLVPPVITAPFAGQTLMVSQVRPVKVSWQAVDGADYYTVKLIDKTKNIIIEESSVVKGLEASFRMENIAEKSDLFECSVQPVTEATDFSGIKRGTPALADFRIRNADPVKLISPLADARIDGLKAFREPVILSWQNGVDVPEKSQFILQKLQPAGNFKTLSVVENPAKQVSMPDLGEGTYRWIVNASLSDGTPVNAAGYQTFVILPVPELNKPVLAEPAMNFVMDAKFLRKNRTLRFRWNAVEGATDYTFSLYKKTSGAAGGSGGGVKMQHIITEKTGKNTFVRFKDLKLLDVGEFEWQVTAFSYDKKGRQEQHSKVSVSSFSIKIDLPGTVNIKDPGEIFIE